MLIYALVMSSKVYEPCLMKENKHKLLIMQNRCLHFDTDGRRYDHITVIYKELSLLELNELHFFCLVYMAIKILHTEYVIENF